MRIALLLFGAALVISVTGVSESAAQIAPLPVASGSDTTATSEVPQRDIFDLIFRRDVQAQITSTNKTGLSWALLPTFSYNPVYGVALGIMATGAGQRGSPDARYSSMSVSGNASTTGQIQAQVRGDMFSKSGNTLLKLDFRYLDTERSTWGLGPVSSNQQEYPMDFALYRAYATFYRVTSGPVFVGLGYHYDEFNNIVDQRAEQGEATPFTTYSRGDVSRTVASGLSINVLGDTRDNLVNPSMGYYLAMSFRNYNTVLGSDRNWQEMWAEMRVYPHVPKHGKNVLAFWLYTWFTFGPAPYLNLPADGWDTYGRGARGYLQGRIRGANQIYFETEYRFSLTRDGLWGAVVFANLTATTNPESQTFGRSDPGGGIGLRIKFNKRADTNLTVDMAWGRDDSWGVFLGMSEVF
jgi:hypothetical protein